MKTIPIFFTFDNNYVEPAAVAFYSLLNKAKSDVFYKMYVLHSDITKDKQNLLMNIVQRFENAQLKFVDTKSEFKKEWENGSFNSKYANSTFTISTLIKCFGAKFFPQYEKIIYSDVDIVVTDDISEIFDIDLTDKYVAGVKGAFSKYFKNELSHLKPEHFEMLRDKYIAGGIWVMNLKKIREDNLEEKMCQIINDTSIEKRFPDQDIINISCEGKVGYLPLNYISYPYMIDLLQKPDFISDYSREELYDSIINPKIIHFAAGKPWNSNPQYSNLWWTIFSYLGLEKTKIFKNVKDKSKKYKKLYNIFLICFIISLVINCIILLFMR